jgi:hypothetical protein
MRFEPPEFCAKFRYQGRWTEANDAASKILQIPNLSVVPRTGALLALGRVLVRQGDSNAQTILDEALDLSLEVGGLPRLDSPWAARAEIAWLSGPSLIVPRYMSF